ncbi:MAG: T9SS type A sorting domain-containing protein [Bacteroidota bacterium]
MQQGHDSHSIIFGRDGYSVKHVYTKGYQGWRYIGLEQNGDGRTIAEYSLNGIPTASYNRLVSGASLYRLNDFNSGLPKGRIIPDIQSIVGVKVQDQSGTAGNRPYFWVGQLESAGEVIPVFGSDTERTESVLTEPFKPTSKAITLYYSGMLTDPGQHLQLILADTDGNHIQTLNANWKPGALDNDHETKAIDVLANFNKVTFHLSEIPQQPVVLKIASKNAATLNWVQVPVGDRGFKEKGAEEAQPTEETISDLPTKVALLQNYPNPFNPTTTLTFNLPARAQVNLEVYNMLGQQVSVLANGTFNPGSHVLEFDAARLATGMYIARMSVVTDEGEAFVESIKMMLMK